MQAHLETILATIPGSHEQERLLVVLFQEPGQGSRIELRQQSWGEGVGWYTQSRLPLEPHQVAHLRGVLGTEPAHSPERGPGLPRAFSRSTPTAAPFPRVVRADSA